ncbi:MAG: UDP-N-acetylglucosamine 2-epimerase (non-hydrolyzing) [Anaerolineales bacterium]|jgi:UDP-N-acetylglucosamine 2-epimerase (non-hydrolysing)
MPDTTLRVLSIFGTRPEAVKMAPVVRRLSQTAGIESMVCVTAQHRQMLDQVLDIFQIEPQIDLDLMRPDQTLPDLTAAVLQGLDPILADLQPDWILVQGDTTTVMAAGLLAYYHRVRLGHVEAGLRTGNKWQPFPEEVNRRMAAVVADLHFAPTTWARDNLLAEGISPAAIVVTGNPVIDALLQIAEQPFHPPAGPLAALPAGRELILMTAHRRENFGPPLRRIFGAVRELAEEYRDRIHVLYPIHLNPNVQEPAKEILQGMSNVTLTEPLGYREMVYAMQRCRFVLTDSGGLQEEAPALGKPVLVMREVTERPEAVQAGTARLVGSDPERILQAARTLLEDEKEYQTMARAVNPYGDGHAAERIVDAIRMFAENQV